MTRKVFAAAWIRGIVVVGALLCVLAVVGIVVDLWRRPHPASAIAAIGVAVWFVVTAWAIRTDSAAR